MSERGDRIRTAGSDARNKLEEIGFSIEALSAEIADVIEEMEEAADIFKPEVTGAAEKDPSGATAKVSKGAE